MPSHVFSSCSHLLVSVRQYLDPGYNCKNGTSMLRPVLALDFFFYISGLQTRICNLSPLALKFVSTKVKIFPNFAALRRLGFVITNLKLDSANPRLRFVSHVVSMYIYYQISTFTIVCMYKLLLT